MPIGIQSLFPYLSYPVAFCCFLAKHTYLHYSYSYRVFLSLICERLNWPSYDRSISENAAEHPGWWYHLRRRMNLSRSLQSCPLDGLLPAAMWFGLREHGQRDSTISTLEPELLLEPEVTLKPSRTMWTRRQIPKEMAARTTNRMMIMMAMTVLLWTMMGYDVFGSCCRKRRRRPFCFGWNAVAEVFYFWSVEMLNTFHS